MLRCHAMHDLSCHAMLRYEYFALDFTPLWVQQRAFSYCDVLHFYPAVSYAYTILLETRKSYISYFISNYVPNYLIQFPTYCYHFLLFLPCYIMIIILFLLSHVYEVIAHTRRSYIYTIHPQPLFWHPTASCAVPSSNPPQILAHVCFLNLLPSIWVPAPSLSDITWMKPGGSAAEATRKLGGIYAPAQAWACLGCLGLFRWFLPSFLLLLSGFPKRYLVELMSISVLSCLTLVYQRYTDLLTPHLTGTGGQVVVLVHQPRLHK